MLELIWAEQTVLVALCSGQLLLSGEHLMNSLHLQFSLVPVVVQVSLFSVYFSFHYIIASFRTAKVNALTGLIYKAAKLLCIVVFMFNK